MRGQDVGFLGVPWAPDSEAEVGSFIDTPRGSACVLIARNGRSAAHGRGIILLERHLAERRSTKQAAQSAQPSRATHPSPRRAARQPSSRTCAE